MQVDQVSTNINQKGGIQKVDIQEAGKKSTIKEGGLARLVFGKGEEPSSAEKSDEKMKSSEENASPATATLNVEKVEETVNVDEIKIELVEEEIKQETLTD